jgi:hypothetical protein
MEEDIYKLFGQGADWVEFIKLANQIRDFEECTIKSNTQA